MASMLGRRACRSCVCFDCGDPARNRVAWRLVKRSAKRREQRVALLEVRNGTS